LRWAQSPGTRRCPVWCGGRKARPGKLRKDNPDHESSDDTFDDRSLSRNRKRMNKHPASVAAVTPESRKRQSESAGPSRKRSSRQRRVNFASAQTGGEESDESSDSANSNRAASTFRRGGGGDVFRRGYWRFREVLERGAAQGEARDTGRRDAQRLVREVGDGE
jgi:hypothetical protein